MGDIGKGAGMHKGRAPLEGLHQIGHDRILEQHRHRPGGADIFGGDSLGAAAAGDHHAAETLAQIRQSRGQGEHRHDLAGHRDIIAGLALLALLLIAQSDADPAQQPIVDIHHPLPGDVLRIDVEAEETAHLLEGEVGKTLGLDAEPLHPAPLGDGKLALLAEQPRQLFVIAALALVQHPGVDGGREQVGGSGDGVNIPGQMKVKVLHRDNLAVAAARGPSLDTEGRTLRGLADAGEDALLKMGAQGLGKSQGGGGLAFTQGRRCRRGHDDIFAVGPVRQTVENREPDLGLVVAIRLQLLRQNPGFAGQAVDFFHARGLGNSDVTRHRLHGMETDGTVGGHTDLYRLCCSGNFTHHGISSFSRLNVSFISLPVYIFLTPHLKNSAFGAKTRSQARIFLTLGLNICNF